MSVKNNYSLIFVVMIVYTAAQETLVVRNDNHMSNFSYLPKPVSAEILNGSSTIIEINSSNFVFCRINDSSVSNLHRMKIIWRDQNGNLIRERKNTNSLYSVVNYGPHLPYSYLNFISFQIQSAGIFNCELIEDNSLLHSSSITVSPKMY